ncbi:hypothetical protein BHE74_00033237, partial [Ensete ventricosum]
LVAGGSPLRVSYSRPPMRTPRYKRLCPQAALLPASVAPVGYCPYGRLPPLAGASGLPCGLALIAVGRPLAGSWPRPGRGWPALHGAGRGWLPLLLVAFAAKM